MKMPASKSPKSEKKLLLKKVIISNLDARKSPIIGDIGDQSTNASCHYTQTVSYSL